MWNYNGICCSYCGVEIEDENWILILKIALIENLMFTDSIELKFTIKHSIFDY